MRLFIVVGCVCIGIILQSYLSMKKNKWWGLVIPLVVTLQIFFAAVNEISHYDSYFSRGGSAPITVLILADFLIGGIVLVLNLIIYWICRIKLDKDNKNI